jgi:hypothetical protein
MKWFWCGFALAALLIVAWMGRYQIITANPSAIAYRLDRWTGNAWMITGGKVEHLSFPPLDDGFGFTQDPDPAKRDIFDELADEAATNTTDGEDFDPTQPYELLVPVDPRPK